MPEIGTNACRICLTSNKEDNITDSSCFTKFFIQVTSFTNFKGVLWLCLWCKAAMKKTIALIKLALESENARNNKDTNIQIDYKNFNRLSYVYNLNIDIPPEVIKTQELETNHTYYNITEETEEITNSINKITNQTEIQFKPNKDELNSIDESNEIRNLNDDSILENDVPNSNNDSIFENKVKLRKNRKQLNCTELNFEVEYLKLEEQLKEVALKKVKYKDFKFQCNYCGMGFLTGDVLEEHRLRHLESFGPHLCNICALYFKSQDVLSQHTLAHRRRFKCVLCATIFKRWAHCIAHRYKCGGVVQIKACGVCKKIFSNEYSLKIHMKVHKMEKKYSCEDCDRKFATKQHLTVHMRSHSGIKPFSCLHCDRSFATSSGLRAHSAVHSDTNQYYCVECNTNYKTAKSLKRHFNESARHKTLETDMYSCKECTKQFSTEKSLKYHISALHGTEYRCKHCDKTFSKSSNLNKHIKCVHTTT